LWTRLVVDTHKPINIGLSNLHNGTGSAISSSQSIGNSYYFAIKTAKIILLSNQ